MKISIIIPVLNEAPLIEQTLRALQPLREAGHEVIVVDGGSHDDTVTRSKPYADQMIQGTSGRSRQMNAGVKLASHEPLLFLRADTFLPEGANGFIVNGMNGKRIRWGRFDVKLSGKHPLLRIIEFLMNWRSRLSRIATGDQAIFVKRDLFEATGGFPEVDLMEDIAFCKILKKYGRPLCLYQSVLTSSRRWEEKGLFRTVLLMWFLRLAYFFKVNSDRLAKLYPPSQNAPSGRTGMNAKRISAETPACQRTRLPARSVSAKAGSAGSQHTWICFGGFHYPGLE